jgi:hypothetical protein
MNWTKDQLAAFQARTASAPKPDRQNYSAEVEVERDLHEQFIQWLNLREIHRYHFRMDRKSPIPGAPDFTLHYGQRVCFIEFKVGKNDLSPDQAAYHASLGLAKCEVSTARSLQEAIWHARMTLRI